MKTNLIRNILTVAAIALLAGCAVGGGAKVTKTVAVENGVTNSTETATTRPFIAFGDAVQKVSSVKAGNTKTGNSINVTGVDQETSGTNAVQFMKELNTFLQNIPK